MLTMDRLRRGLRGPVAVALTAALLLSSAQIGMAATSTSDLEPSGAGTGTREPAASLDLKEARERVSQLRTEVDDLTARNDELTEDNSTLQETVDSLSRERDRLADSLAHFDDLYEPLEADRLLLLELRKGLPETRPEAEAQLDRIGRLALESDPARLGQLVDRLNEAAPAFLEWRFTEFADTQEATQAYLASGASAFESSMEALRDGVLLSVHNRLDGILNVLERVR